MDNEKLIKSLEAGIHLEKDDLPASLVEQVVIKLYSCKGKTDHWGCQGCPHSEPHELDRHPEHGSCGSWGECGTNEKNVRCTKVL